MRQVFINMFETTRLRKNPEHGTKQEKHLHVICVSVTFTSSETGGMIPGPHD